MYSVADIRGLEGADIEFVAANMREIDRREVWEMTGSSPRDAIVRAVSRTEEPFTVTLNDVPTIVCGCTRPHGIRMSAAPWLLGTDDMAFALRAGGTRVRITKDLVDGWLARAGILENWIAPDNDVAMRWVRWLGFTVDPVAPAGLFGRPFQRFWREA